MTRRRVKMLAVRFSTVAVLFGAVSVASLWFEAACEWDWAYRSVSVGLWTAELHVRVRNYPTNVGHLRWAVVGPNSTDEFNYGSFGFEYHHEGVAVPLWGLFGLTGWVAAYFVHRLRRIARQGCCTRCGYDLTGVPAGVCPECGPAAVRPPGVVLGTFLTLCRALGSLVSRLL
jgi:hypothetical protein